MEIQRRPIMVTISIRKSRQGDLYLVHAYKHSHGNTKGVYMYIASRKDERIADQIMRECEKKPWPELIKIRNKYRQRKTRRGTSRI
jgi:hypothetical protein